jgi:hypothetical protein
MDNQTFNVQEIELAKISYQRASNEIVQRISLRDNFIILYIGAIATIIAASLSDKGSLQYLLFIPILSFGFVYIISHQNKVIGGLAEFIQRELEPVFEKNNIKVPFWDSSITLRNLESKLKFLRRTGQLGIVILPAIISLILNFDDIFGTPFFKFIWITCLIITILSAYILFESHKYNEERFSD